MQYRRTAKRVFQKVAAISTVFVLATSSLGLASLATTDDVSAATIADITTLKITQAPGNVEAGTGTTPFAVKAIYETALGWTNVLALKNPTTVSVTTPHGQVALNCDPASWETTVTVTIPLTRIVESPFCFRGTQVGSHTLTATASIPRLLGGTTVVTLPIPITIVDSQKPPAPGLLSPANGAYLQNGFDFSWSSVSDVSNITYVWQASLSSETDINGAFVTPFDTRAGLSGTTLDEGGMPASTYFWHVKAVDSAGNESTWSETWSVTIDSVGPVVTIMTPEAATVINNGSTVFVSGTVVDSSVVSKVLEVYDTDGTAVYTETVTSPEGSFSFSWDTAGLPNGTYTIIVRAIDAANNVGQAEVSVTLQPKPVVKETNSGNSAGTTTNQTPPAVVPAGLVATQFNTTNPATLGIATNTAVNTSGEPRVEAARTPEPKEKEVITQTSSNNGWWILLVMAALVAAYYAYRNWRLKRDTAANA